MTQTAGQVAGSRKRDIGEVNLTATRPGEGVTTNLSAGKSYREGQKGVLELSMTEESTSFLVDIGAGTEDLSYSNGSGTNYHSITDSERKAFSIDGWNLNQVAGTYMGTKPPHDAWTRDPCDGKHYYWDFGYPPIVTKVVLKKSEIKVDPNPEPVIIYETTFSNDSSEESTGHVVDQVNVATTCSSSWQETHGIEVSEQVTVKGTFLGVGAEASTGFKYSYAWGKGGAYSESTTIGGSSGVDVPIPPHQTRGVRITTTQATASVTNTYRAELTGTTVVKYKDKISRGSTKAYTWGIEINAGLRSSQLPLVKEITETIELGYHFNTNVEIFDPTTGKVLEVHSLAATPAREQLTTE